MSELEKLFKMADRNQFGQVSLVHVKTVNKTHSSIKNAEQGIIMKWLKLFLCSLEAIDE